MDTGYAAKHLYCTDCTNCTDYTNSRLRYVFCYVFRYILHRIFYRILYRIFYKILYRVLCNALCCILYPFFIGLPPLYRLDKDSSMVINSKIDSGEHSKKTQQITQWKR